MRQILFQIGPLKFYSYGLMLGLSFAVGIYLALWRARREQVSEDQIFTIAVGLVICAIVGSKGLHVLVQWKQFIADPIDFLKHFGGGFVFYGGFLACMLFLVIMNRKYGIGLLRLFDIYAPSVALGLGFTRIGCFLAGCCFGIPTACPLGVTFPEGSFAFQKYGKLIPIHPTQLYSSMDGFLIFLILILFLKFHGKRFHGQLFAIFMIIYSTFRFLVEFIRGDTDRGFYFGLYTSQWISIFAFLVGIAVLLSLWRNKEKRLDPPIGL